MKECSFQPTIDKKSDKIIKHIREAPAEKTYETLHKKHKQQVEKAKKLVKDKQSKEMSECTFAPQLVSKQKAVPGRPSMAHQTSVPLEEPGSGIQLPS